MDRQQTWLSVVEVAQLMAVSKNTMKKMGRAGASTYAKNRETAGDIGDSASPGALSPPHTDRKKSAWKLKFRRRRAADALP
jgi:hypothetical protein